MLNLSFYQLSSIHLYVDKICLAALRSAARVLSAYFPDRAAVTTPSALSISTTGQQRLPHELHSPRGIPRLQLPTLIPGLSYRLPNTTICNTGPQIWRQRKGYVPRSTLRQSSRRKRSQRPQQTVLQRPERRTTQTNGPETDTEQR